jgi:elongation factor P hydroxylase
MHHYQHLIKIFNNLFQQAENTILVKGEHEPLYLPASSKCPHAQVIFAHGFYQSALHEIAHWCIAGQDRRQLVDYGYWYQPDGRSAEQQKIFEQVEIKPQALEWMFSVAAGSRFYISADNLSGEETEADHFKLAVYQQVKLYVEHGPPARAQRFLQGLLEHYSKNSIKIWEFDIKNI